ncbi:META domain-containing protein [Pseudoalteromonas sp. G4]|uniref:META domain-containing protein n=1 Tax=Pseudoalteromonas sp. G4 TaxID=2992761 RepID=UPI00237E681A|nr:META domain-containing protein [Pseudoalteromonas sp. G4]MDE3273623.1 META domain-containing protein [Pseudoalteromonas sp. G4]
MNRFAKPLLLCSLIATGSMTLAGCQSAPEVEEKVMNSLQTEVYYLDRSMLPPNSELTVTLEDVSKMDVAATVISSKLVTLNSAPPYQVSLDYDNALIKDNMRYNVRAQIRKDGKLLYTSTQSNNPFASDEPLKIRVTKVAPPVKPNVSLTNTYWKAMVLNGESVNTPQGARELFVQLKADGSVKGFAGCNNFMGSFIAKEYGLRFKGMASTMKMCQGRANDLDRSMHQVLQDTFEYKIKGETLTLFNESKEKIAQFNAVYF